MEFRSVTLYNHRGGWHIQESILKEEIKAIVETVNHKQRVLDIYLMARSKAAYGTDTGTIRIFIGATPGPHELNADTVKTEHGEYIVEFLKLSSTEESTPLLDGNGTVVAYKENDKQAYYIPFELAKTEEPIIKDIVKHAVKVIVKESLAEIENENSWIKTRDKKSIVEAITSNFSSTYRDKEERLKRNIGEAERAIREYTTSLKRRYDVLTDHKRELAALKNDEDSNKVIENFITGLDQISEHPRVSDLQIEGDIIEIKIDDVYAYAEIRGEERRFYIGNMKVKININNTDVQFYGDNKRRGYWGQDPHPHVDGENGRACLGNVASSIAELCSQKEIYGLFLVAMDFLENANTQDPAGRRVVMWDEVDEDGNIIREGAEETTWSCDYCGDGQEDDSESYSVYTVYEGNGEISHEEDWCEYCKDEHASWDEHNEEYVTDSVYSLVEEYLQEDDDDDENEEESA